ELGQRIDGQRQMLRREWSPREHLLQPGLHEHQLPRPRLIHHSSREEITMKHIITVSLIAAPLLLAVTNAAATPVACGSVSNGWDAPLGAAVFTTGSGPIDAVIGAIGEFRSHSMLSHGPGGWVSHATMKTPDQNGWPQVCGQPINPGQLASGSPGVEQVDQ